MSLEVLYFCSDPVVLLGVDRDVVCFCRLCNISCIFHHQVGRIHAVWPAFAVSQTVLELTSLLLLNLRHGSTLQTRSARVFACCVLGVASSLGFYDLAVWIHLDLGTSPQASELELHLLYLGLRVQCFLQVRVLAGGARLGALVHDGGTIEAHVLHVGSTVRHVAA